MKSRTQVQVSEPTILARVPFSLRWRSYLRRGDEVAELDHIWTLSGIWRKQPESFDPLWDTRAIGPFVLAYRLTL